MLGILTGNVIVIAINAIRWVWLKTTTKRQQQQLSVALNNDSLCPLTINWLQCTRREKTKPVDDILLTKLEAAQKEHHSRQTAAGQ